jgi:hypothetical protein
VKRCCTCKQTKPPTEFFRNKSRSDGLADQCRPCHAAWKASARQERPDRFKAYDRARDLKRHYGITLDHYNALLEKQNGRCAVCDTTENGGGVMCVDHDHATGAFRGLLCHNCNRALGLLADDPDRIDALLTYLTRPRPSVNPA